MMNSSGGTLDGLPKRFVTAMRTLFDILDEQKTDCVRFSDIEQFWQDDGAKGLPKGVIESLRKVTPPSGMLTFERFCAGLKICLLRNQMEAQKMDKPMQDFRKPMTKRPPSAPTLDSPENNNKISWANTATVRPNNAMASRTLSMPQLQPLRRDTYVAQPPPVHTETFSVLTHKEPFLEPPPQPLHQSTPFYSGPSNPLYGPPKPPRSAVNLLQPVPDHYGATYAQDTGMDRADIRSALQSWQKGQILQDLDANRNYPRGRSMGDGKPAGYADQPVKKPLQRKREPRRHTLQNGVDYNMVKKLKQIEQEKEMLMQGLAAVDRTREWYLKQIALVHERIKYLGRVGTTAEPWSEAHAERLELQKARVLEVNRHLSALTESWERGGLPLHMNLAVRHLPNSDLSRVKHQNHLLTKEVSEKSEKISSLEKEKSALLRELYQVRSRMPPQMRPIDKIHDRAFM